MRARSDERRPFVVIPTAGGPAEGPLILGAARRRVEGGNGSSPLSGTAQNLMVELIVHGNGDLLHRFTVSGGDPKSKPASHAPADGPPRAIKTAASRHPSLIPLPPFLCPPGNGAREWRQGNGAQLNSHASPQFSSQRPIIKTSAMRGGQPEIASRGTCSIVTFLRTTLAIVLDLLDAARETFPQTGFDA